jgi:hypothetical protein
MLLLKSDLSLTGTEVMCTLIAGTSKCTMTLKLWHVPSRNGQRDKGVLKLFLRTTAAAGGSLLVLQTGVGRY